MILKKEVMNLIAEQLDQMFTRFFDQKWVAVTFAGEIIAIEAESVVLLKKLQTELSEEKGFLHQINGDRH